MSKVIVFGNRKGGTGKTTLTALCANAISSPPFSRSVYVADIDQQQSLIRRRLLDIQSYTEIPPYKIGAPTLAELLGDLPDLDRKHEFIFIDHAAKLDANLPADQQEISKILLVADFLFIPITPGNYALDSTLDYLKLALKIKAKRPDRPLNVYALANMSEPRTLDAQELSDQLAELQAVTPIEIMSAQLGRYALFRAVDTLTSFYDPESPEKAKRNFAEFITEFIKIVDQ